MIKSKKVFVMLSGGVDSSVAAFLLKKQGFDVTAVYFKRYKPNGNKELCMQDGKSAQKVAKHLGIEFKVWDFEREYKKHVFDYLIESYKKGKTPNPDIICNRKIKFGLFAKRAFSEGADFIASGHYAKIANCIFCPECFCFGAQESIFGNPSLREAKDKNKDQSYFLSHIDKDVLKRVIFPLHNLKKKDTRKIAKKAGLHTAGKKDSQGMCFIGKKQKLKDFLLNFIEKKEGVLLNIQGNQIGSHDGVFFYTTGERRGFSLNPKHQKPNAEALYVISKNIDKNSITVATKEEFEKEMNKIKYLKLKNLNVLLEPKLENKYKLRIRHRGNKTEARLVNLSNKQAVLELLEPVFAPAEGQFVALYNKFDAVVLSGEIKEIN